MSVSGTLRRNYNDLLTAVHFLTCIPVPPPPYRSDSLARSIRFFPIVGLLVGGSAGVAHVLIAPHFSRIVTSLAVVLLLVLLTGCLHEDGLADAADGFGGGWNRTQIIDIMHDSRIGSYGAVALVLSLLSRIFLVSSISLQSVVSFLIAAHILSRWTALPLSYYLPSAHSADLVAANPQQTTSVRLSDRIAGSLTLRTLIWTSLISFAITGLTLRWRAPAAISAAMVVTLLSGLLYKRKLGGVTGDCFGTTNQLTEIAVYIVGAWII